MLNIFTITMTPINPPFDDGPKNIVFGVAQRLKDYRFYFITFLGRCFSRPDNTVFIISPFQPTGRHKMFLLQKVYISLIAMFMINKIDLFQFFFTPRPYFSSVFRRLLKRYNKVSIQIVSSVHTLLAKNRENEVSSLFFSDCVIVQSDYAKARLEGLGIRNVVRIYPGVDLNRFNKYGFESSAIKDERVNIIYPGTYEVLNDAYSLDEFCKIAIAVIEQYREARFTMVCRIREKQEYYLERKFKSMVEHYGLIDKFIFLNTLEDLPALFSKSSMVIMPSNKPMAGILEIPLVLLEMAALGKPVVFGRSAPLGELAGLGVGLQVKEESSHGYSELVIRLLKDKEFNRVVSRNSKEAVEKHFNMDCLARQYGEVYDSLKRKAYGS